VPFAFQALATRVARLVPCDRVGIALLSEDGKEFQTYTARVHDEERRSRPRPEIVFKVEHTIIGQVVNSGEPLIIPNVTAASPDYLDANILRTSGFESALLVPLVAHGRAVGTLNVVSRRPANFARQHAEALLPIAEILGVAWMAQQLHVTLGRHRTMEVMSELTLSVAAEINSALQTIIGHCDLIVRGQHDPALERDHGTGAADYGTARQDAHRRQRSPARDHRNDLPGGRCRSGRHLDADCADHEKADADHADYADHQEHQTRITRITRIK
jgi:hypothetical protein